MVWNAAKILWDQQVLLMWIVLPPVFVAGGLLAFAAPVLFHEKKKSDSGRADAAPMHASADRRA